MGFREHVALEVEPVEEGTGRVCLDAGEEHLNPHGTVHGGVLATMIDVAMGTAVATTGGESPVTVSLTVTYLEPGQPGTLVATARVRKRGKRLIVVEAEVVQGDDVVADALATFSVKPS
ncbi:MAG: thioesterase superfamily protein [Frankiales bacterium]|nr:thioesterase superfamily protein [Frankiales bacterium]